MLPESAREELRKAAMTSTDVDPLARVKAIEKVMKKLRIRHPECFKVEEDETEETMMVQNTHAETRQTAPKDTQ